MERIELGTEDFIAVLEEIINDKVICAAVYDYDSGRVMVASIRDDRITWYVSPGVDEMTTAEYAMFSAAFKSYIPENVNGLNRS